MIIRDPEASTGRVIERLKSEGISGPHVEKLVASIFDELSDLHRGKPSAGPKTESKGGA